MFGYFFYEMPVVLLVSFYLLSILLCNPLYMDGHVHIVELNIAGCVCFI